MTPPPFSPSLTLLSSLSPLQREQVQGLQSVNCSLQEEQQKKAVQERGGARAGTWENRYLPTIYESLCVTVGVLGALLSCALCVCACIAPALWW